MAFVQFNLLPDVKLKYIEAKRLRNLLVSVSVLITAACMALFLVLFITVGVLQKAQMDSAATKVTDANKKLKATSNLNQIITVQNQLQALAGLHQTKHVTSRVFDYLQQLTPTSASVGKIDMDLTANSIAITGDADSQATVNKFIDTLKYTTYKVGSADTAHQAFTSVVESNFTINPSNVSYGINIQFDPKLFANNLVDNQGKIQVPKLSVPSLTTTHAVLNDSSYQLFQATTNPSRQ